MSRETWTLDHAELLWGPCFCGASTYADAARTASGPAKGLKLSVPHLFV
jgi:hypothetical protein